MKNLINTPAIKIWINSPLTSWTGHGERVNPKNWPWYVFCKFGIVDIDFNPYARYGVGEHPQPTPKLYKRIYLYTRNKAYNMDVRIS